MIEEEARPSIDLLFSMTIDPMFPNLGTSVRRRSELIRLKKEREIEKVPVQRKSSRFEKAKYEESPKKKTKKTSSGLGKRRKTL